MSIVNRFCLGTGSQSNDSLESLTKTPYVSAIDLPGLRHHCKQTYPTRKFVMMSHTHKLLQSRGELSCKNDPKSGCISQSSTTPRGSSPVIPVRGICAPKAVIQLTCPSIWPNNTALYSSNAVCLTHLAEPVLALAQQVKLNCKHCVIMIKMRLI